MNAVIKEKIKNHVAREKFTEACGFVWANQLSGEYGIVECENIQEERRGKFEISTKDYLKAENLGTIVAYYHSHPMTEEGENMGFSKRDIEVSEECCIPALLYIPLIDEWQFYDPEGSEHVSLTNRPFIRAIWDCYTLGRDYFKDLGIHLGYHFPPDTNEFFDYDHFDSRYESEGFREVSLSEIKKNDVMLFAFKSKTSNHVAIYMGDNQILHQPLNRRSLQEDLSERYFKYLTKVLRHEKYE